MDVMNKEKFEFNIGNGVGLKSPLPLDMIDRFYFGSEDFISTNNNVREAQKYLQIKSWGGAKASTSKRSSKL
jgi:hypothetical protein